jgi:ribosomal protein L11 methylase PrmA
MLNRCAYVTRLESAKGGSNVMEEKTESSSSSIAASDLQSLTLVCLEQEPSLVADFLMEIGACSVSVTDYDKDDDEHETPIFAEPAVVMEDWACGRNVWSRCDVTAHLPASFHLEQVVQLVRDTFDMPQLEFRRNELVSSQHDWVQHVQSSWKPIVLEDGLFVLRFPWHTPQDVQEALQQDANKNNKNQVSREDVVELELEGGIAFGTGEHPTTQLCLNLIRTQVMHLQDQDKEGKIRVCDYGAGSGVLGLAACALSKNAEAVGVEIDPDAIRIADANAAVNQLPMKSYLPPFIFGVENDDDTNGGLEDAESASILLKAHNRLGTEIPMLPDALNGPLYDIMVANILAHPLVKLAPTIAAMTKSPGGQLGLSGILSNQADMVLQAYEPYFDSVQVAQESNGWILITGTRK